MVGPKKPQIFFLKCQGPKNSFNDRRKNAECEDEKVFGKPVLCELRMRFQLSEVFSGLNTSI